MFKSLFLVFFLSVAFVGKCLALSTFDVCMILDKGGKDDKAFNQMAYEGVQQAIESGLVGPQQVKIVVAQSDVQSMQFVRGFSTSGCPLIIAVGYNNGDVVAKVAPKFPKNHYVVLDSPSTLSNVHGITFRHEEGGYLAGVLAGIQTKTGVVGFLGGMNVPIIKSFWNGYKKGVQQVNAKAKLIELYVDVSPMAWNNPPKAREEALSIYHQGADILFVAAGASSQGAYDAVKTLSEKAATPHQFVIGSDVDASCQVPGLVLASIEKKVNYAVFNEVKNFKMGRFQSGHSEYGLKEGYLDITFGSCPNSSVSEKTIKRLESIKDLIKSGKIKTS